MSKASVTSKDTAAAAAPAPKSGKVKQLKPMDELERAMKAHRWWEAEALAKGTHWRTLEHPGVVFPADYTPTGVPLVYDGKDLVLTQQEEEWAMFFAAISPDGPQLGNPKVAERFKANYESDLLGMLGSQHTIKSLDKCDFTKLRDELARAREERKNRSAAEKAAEKAEKDAQVMRHGFALVDGHLERIGNYSIEPPGLFRGRGQHPKTGTVKLRVMPEEITINVATIGAVPPCPMPGHSWGSVVQDPSVTWLAFWRENVMNGTKYVYLAASSSFKGKSDQAKYEKARKLKGEIDNIRKHYETWLNDEDAFIAQCGTACWVIDRLALRAGGEKDENEADTVGCCSLRVEHITFGKPDVHGEDAEGMNSDGLPEGFVGDPDSPYLLTLDFLGKDSMRYFQCIDLGRYGKIGQRVYNNLERFVQRKTPDQDIFDTLNPSLLNGQLQRLMSGLSAKVFRTFNASFTLQQELPWDMPVTATDDEKLLAYNRANREVAILCNHQRTVPKSFQASFDRQAERLALLDSQVKELHTMVTAAKAGKPVRAKTALPKEDLTDEQKQVKAAEMHLFNSETPALDKVKARLKVFTSRRNKLRLSLKDKADNKTVALGTSKINYMDPRITVAWCKTVELPIEKTFAKALRDKFPWACGVESTWKF